MMVDKVNWAQKRRYIRKDIILTSVIGPLSIGTSIVAHILLYPIILSRSGINVLGLWSLIATIAAYFSLANVGFTPLLLRSMSAATSESAFIAIRRDHKAATRFYAVTTLVLLSFWLFTVWIAPFNDISSVYSWSALGAAVSIQIIGIGISAAAQLSSAVLSGANQTYSVQAIDVFVPVIRYTVALAGAFIARPIEGFAIGTFFAAIFQVIAYRFRLRYCVSVFFTAPQQMSMIESLVICVDLMRRGFHYYTISLAQVFREPLFRLIIASTLGFGAAGIYEIAFRIPAAIREVATVGTRALFPTFSYYHSVGSTEEIRRLVCQTLILLITFAHLSLLTFALGAEQIFAIWLPDVPNNLVPATNIATLFWAITVLNVPFWYILQTNGQERVAARSLLYHTVGTILLFPLTTVFDFSLQMMLWYWVINSVFTQFSIYFAAERSTGSVVSTLRHPLFIRFAFRFIFVVILMICTSYALSSVIFDNITELCILSSAAVISFTVFLLPVVWPYLQSIFRSS